MCLSAFVAIYISCVVVLGILYDVISKVPLLIPEFVVVVFNIEFMMLPYIRYIRYHKLEVVLKVVLLVMRDAKA